MKLWLDDFRPMPADYDVQVRTAGQAIWLLGTGTITEVSLDHDLGDDSKFGTGYSVAVWIERQSYEGSLRRLKWHIHSDNVVGRQKILQAMENAERHWLENEMAGEKP